MDEEEPNDTEKKCEGWPMQELKGMMGVGALTSREIQRVHVHVHQKE